MCLVVRDDIEVFLNDSLNIYQNLIEETRKLIVSTGFICHILYTEIDLSVIKKNMTQIPFSR